MASVAASRRDALAHWWHVRSRREQAVLGGGGAALLLALAWAFVWQPVVLDNERLTRVLATDRARLAEAKREADEIAGLARALALPSGDVRAALDAVLAQQGLRNAATAIEPIDETHLRLTFDAIGFNTLVAFLDAAQRSAHLRAAELTATARVEAGQVRADITLTR